MMTMRFDQLIALRAMVPVLTERDAVEANAIIDRLLLGEINSLTQAYVDFQSAMVQIYEEALCVPSC